MKFRKKPIVVEAIQYTGANHAEIETFAPGMFEGLDVADRVDNPSVTAEVWDKLHDTWVGVKDGQWIIRGVQGEFYPCDPNVLAETYEPVES